MALLYIGYKVLATIIKNRKTHKMEKFSQSGKFKQKVKKIISSFRQDHSLVLVLFNIALEDVDTFKYLKINIDRKPKVTSEILSKLMQGNHVIFSLKRIFMVKKYKNTNL